MMWVQWKGGTGAVGGVGETKVGDEGAKGAEWVGAIGLDVCLSVCLSVCMGDNELRGVGIVRRAAETLVRGGRSGIGVGDNLVKSES
jgi:hypothetical protein